MNKSISKTVFAGLGLLGTVSPALAIQPSLADGLAMSHRAGSCSWMSAAISVGSSADREELAHVLTAAWTDQHVARYALKEDFEKIAAICEIFPDDVVYTAVTYVAKGGTRPRL